MLRILTLCTVAFVLAGCGSTRWMAPAQQSLSAPPEGQVLVNIIRPSGYAGAQDMPIFDATAMEMIGNLRGRERLQYVCPPGERLFIGWGERKSGVQASLKAGQTYDLICDVGMGVWRASVSLRPIPKVDDRRQQLPTWEARSRLLTLADRAGADSWTARRREDVQRIADEFTTSPTDRVMVLQADDHR